MHIAVRLDNVKNNGIYGQVAPGNDVIQNYHLRQSRYPFCLLKLRVLFQFKQAIHNSRLCFWKHPHEFCSRPGSGCRPSISRTALPTAKFQQTTLVIQAKRLPKMGNCVTLILAYGASVTRMKSSRHIAIAQVFIGRFFDFPRTELAGCVPIK